MPKRDLGRSSASHDHKRNCNDSKKATDFDESLQDEAISISIEALDGLRLTHQEPGFYASLIVGHLLGMVFMS